MPDFLHLEARNLTCGYQHSQVFANVNLTLYAGQLAGLVGPSGSGKTTLIKALLGLVPSQSGEVYIQQRRLRPGMPPFRVGYVPQVETVDWNFPVTAEEVVIMGRYRKRRFFPFLSKRDRSLARSLLERVGAAHLAERPIGELSGGQQQRVFLARALVGEPDVVLLDEPTSSSDLHIQHELLHLFADLNAQGLTILLSTHDLNSVATHLPWVIYFNHGIVAQGDPMDVFTTDVLEQTFGGKMVVHAAGDRIMIASGMTSVRHQMRRNLPGVLRQPQPPLGTKD